ncbi:MAG: CinA family nicotinamide mononucleotide deamidase-related protein [Chloroflexi bacterium]|nr:CinA family nicotinamide mononucleotide deamidase-related protein [Chloroflexota bacterium]
MKAEILSIGTELLLGQIVDTNASWLAGRLADLGIDCLWVSTVGDNLGRASDVVSRALGRSDLVVCTGGLGPTEDDLTREAIAAAIGETPAVDPSLHAELRAWFAARGITMPVRNEKQAWLIPSAEALPNPNGTAPGWFVRRDHRILVAMPGVPREMTRMWEAEVEPRLPARAAIRSRTLKLLGIGEGSVEEALAELVRSTSPTVATYAKADGVHVRITDRDADIAARDERIDAMEREVRRRLGRFVWGTDGETLGGGVGAALTARGWSVTTAESVTGGEVARLLSEADAGWYKSGIVLPGADEATLEASLEHVAADVRLLTVGTAEGAVAVVRTPLSRDRAAVRAGSPLESRRRGTLTALDLLRRTIPR